MIIEGKRNLKYRTFRVDICEDKKECSFNQDWRDLVSRILPNFLNKTKIITIPTFYDENCYNHPNFLDICNSMNFAPYAIRANTGIIDKNITKEIRYLPRHIILETKLNRLEDCWNFYEQIKCKIYIALSPDLSDIKSTIKLFKLFKEREKKENLSRKIYLSIDHRARITEEYEELRCLLNPNQKIDISNKITDRIELLRQNFNINFEKFKCDIAKYFIRINLNNSFLKCPNSRKIVDDDKLVDCKNCLCQEPECSFYLLEYGRKEKI